MKIVAGKLTRGELKDMTGRIFDGMVKAAVDVEREIVALDAELHSDLEALLLEDGSQQKSLWGINLYPEKEGDGWVEFDSMINMRPSHGNKSRGVDSAEIRAKILKVVAKRIER